MEKLKAFVLKRNYDEVLGMYIQNEFEELKGHKGGGGLNALGIHLGRVTKCAY